MSKKRKTQIPLLAFLALLVTGAMNRQVLFSTDALPAEAGDVGTVGSFGGTWVELDRAPRDVLAAFLERHDPERLEWLTLTVWQRMGLKHFEYEARSRIVQGPGQCGRLEMEMTTRPCKSKLLVVSDGKTIAKSVMVEHEEPEVMTTHLSAVAKPSVRQRELNDQGCCGPGVVVQRLLPSLKKWQGKTTKDKREKVIKLSAESTSEFSGLPLPPGTPVRCHLYFDEETLWLRRLEWATVTASGEEVVLEMEFRDAKVNEPLSEECCEREFSFPKGLGKIKEKG